MHLVKYMVVILVINSAKFFFINLHATNVGLFSTRARKKFFRSRLIER